jgi:hypothetical protein
LVNIEDVLGAFSEFLDKAKASAKEPESLRSLHHHLKVLQNFCEINNLKVDFRPKNSVDEIKEPTVIRLDINDKWR